MKIDSTRRLVVPGDREYGGAVTDDLKDPLVAAALRPNNRAYGDLEVDAGLPGHAPVTLMLTGVLRRASRIWGITLSGRKVDISKFGWETICELQKKAQARTCDQYRAEKDQRPNKRRSPRNPQRKAKPPIVATVAPSSVKAVNTQKMRAKVVVSVRGAKKTAWVSISKPDGKWVGRSTKQNVHVVFTPDFSPHDTRWANHRRH